MSRGCSVRDIAFDPSGTDRVRIFVPTANAFPGLTVNVSDPYASNTTAAGPYCFALGELADAGGVSSNVAIGYSSCSASAHADWQGSIAIGPSSAVDGRSCFALGHGASTAAGKTQCSAIGHNASATGDRAFAMGADALADGDHALAVGDGAQANADEAVAVGKDVHSEGFHIGDSITSTGTTCFGINSACTGVADCFEVGDGSATFNIASSCTLISAAAALLYVDAKGCRTEALVTPGFDRLGTYGDTDTVAAADFRDGMRLFYADVAGTLITPTAEDVIAAHPGAIDGDSFEMMVTSFAVDVDWVAGTGVTIDMGTTGYTTGRNFGGYSTHYLCVLDVTNTAMTMYYVCSQ